MPLLAQSVTAYHTLSDEALVMAARSGDELAMEFLINKYKNFVRLHSKNYFIVGAEREDIIQEGLIGLYKAVRDFQAEKISSFRAFAEICITRQIITAIKTATRLKHIPLNQYVSLTKPTFEDDGDRCMIDVLPAPKANPEEIVVTNSTSHEIKERIQEGLSALESDVLQSFLEGKSYQEIANDMDRRVKSIDNALQRVKRKIEENLQGFDFA
jgi:RNA polymerase sporulation-specific sigma factor